MLRALAILSWAVAICALLSLKAVAQQSLDLKGAAFVIDADERARPFSGREVAVSRQMGPYIVRLVWRSNADFLKMQHSEQGAPLRIALEEFQLQRMDPYRKLMPVEGNWCEALGSVHEMVCGDVLARAAAKIHDVDVGLEISPAGINARSLDSNHSYCTDANSNGGPAAFTWPLGSPPGRKCPMFNCNSDVYECYACKDCIHTQDSTCSDSWTCGIVPPPATPQSIAGQCIGALFCSCQ